MTGPWSATSPLHTHCVHTGEMVSAADRRSRLASERPTTEVRRHAVTERFDLVIAGGGPSGSAAGWQAVQTGAKVVVLEKAEFPGDKPCGDRLTARAVSYLQKLKGRNTISKESELC